MIEAIAITDIGKKRKSNQDFAYVTRDKIGNLPNLFVVADGIGGHSGGELASQWTIETIINEIKTTASTDVEEVFSQALNAANIKIRGKAREKAALHGMGTTVVTATVDGNLLQVANVGDSRLYLADTKHKKIRQITVDHSLVEEMISMGELARDEGRHHPEKHVITRAIGAKEKLQSDFFRIELETHELVLLCSDGLSDMLLDEEIGKILYTKKSIEVKAKDLIKTANDKGGFDNITVILIKVREKK
ncbi:MAG: Stp1/IreP family PP2C-type Ser/Thr phosphatase [Lachnospiraceae bacterium]|nr:Stp1/IreP family PP2C-type Ser/Thr phosphatase [Lachnospiraceae bacterium]